MLLSAAILFPGLPDTKSCGDPGPGASWLTACEAAGHAAYAIDIRGGADQTSTRSDILRLSDRLGATVKRYVEIANGAHFVSAERHAWQVFDEVNAFLQERK